MKNRRQLIFVLLMGLLLSLSVGAATAQDEFTFHWWHEQGPGPAADMWQSIADTYMADHPGVTIDVHYVPQPDYKQVLNVAMQSGEPPDLFQSWGGGSLWEFANAGLTRDIAAELEGDWADSFSTQAALELYGQNGEYYGVPWTWGAVGIFYNRALFTQAGLDPDNPPSTWAEFLDAVQTLKDAGITPITLGEGDKWPGHFWWVYLSIRMGGQDAFLAAYNREGSFADEPFVQAGEHLKELIDLEPFPEGYLALGYGDQDTIMGNGEAAMDLMGQWSPEVQRGNSASGEGLGDDLGWFPFPVVEGGAGNPDDVLGGGDGFAVGANAPDEAVDFLRFLTSAENQRAGAAIAGFIVPVVKGTEDAVDSPIIQTIIETRNNAPYSQLYYDQFLGQTLGDTVNDSVQSLFAGVTTPAETAQAIEDVAGEELQQ